MGARRRVGTGAIDRGPVRLARLCPSDRPPTHADGRRVGVNRWPLGGDDARLGSPGVIRAFDSIRAGADSTQQPVLSGQRRVQSRSPRCRVTSASGTMRSMVRYDAFCELKDSLCIAIRCVLRCARPTHRAVRCSAQCVRSPPRRVRCPTDVDTRDRSAARSTHRDDTFGDRAIRCHRSDVRMRTVAGEGGLVAQARCAIARQRRRCKQSS